MAVKDIHTHNAFAESVGAARNQYKLNPLPASVNQAKIDKETYKRWFKYIQDMGANTIRVYTVQQDVFYNALYEYNKDNDNPLYLIHGVWVNDYTQNSHRDALDQGLKERFLSDCRTMLDVIHGNKKSASAEWRRQARAFICTTFRSGLSATSSAYSGRT